MFQLIGSKLMKGIQPTLKKFKPRQVQSIKKLMKLQFGP